MLTHFSPCMSRYRNVASQKGVKILRISKKKTDSITRFPIQKLIYMQIFDFRTWVQDEEWWFLLSIFSKIEGEIWEVGHPLLGDYVSFSKFLPSLSDHPSRIYGISGQLMDYLRKVSTCLMDRYHYEKTERFTTKYISH